MTEKEARAIVKLMGYKFRYCRLSDRTMSFGFSVNPLESDETNHLLNVNGHCDAFVNSHTALGFLKAINKIP